MTRDPFVWQVHLRQDMLDDAIAELRRLPYEVVREIIASPLSKRVKGRDDRTYHLTVTADWRDAGSKTIEVTVHMKHGWIGRTLTQSFAATPPGVVEADELNHPTATESVDDGHGPSGSYSE